MFESQAQKWFIMFLICLSFLFWCKKWRGLHVVCLVLVFRLMVVVFFPGYFIFVFRGGCIERVIWICLWHTDNKINKSRTVKGIKVSFLCHLVKIIALIVGLCAFSEINISEKKNSFILVMFHFWLAWWWLNETVAHNRKDHRKNSGRCHRQTQDHRCVKS